MKNSKPQIREMFRTKVATKFGAECPKIMAVYDKLVAEQGEDKALDSILEILSKFDPKTATQNQFNKLTAQVGELKAQIETATASLKLPLGQAAQTIHSALEQANEQKITVKPVLQRLREAQEKMKAREGKELDVEIHARPLLGVLQTQETYRDGIVERRRVFKSVASTGKVKAGLEIEFRM